MQINEAVILAATEGMRMRPLSQFIPKVLLPVFGKPIILHHLDSLERIGVKHCIITLEPRLGPLVETAVCSCFKGEMEVQFYYQEKRGGLGYAILCCEKLIDLKSNGFIFVFGDEYNTDQSFYNFLSQNSTDLDGLIGIRRAQLQSEITGTATMDLNFVTKKVSSYFEKPSQQQIINKYCTSGRYFFQADLLKHLHDLEHSPETFIKGEHSIGRAISQYIQEGARISFVEDMERHVHFTTIEDYHRTLLLK